MEISRDWEGDYLPPTSPIPMAACVPTMSPRADINVQVFSQSSRRSSRSGRSPTDVQINYTRVSLYFINGSLASLFINLFSYILVL